MQQKSEVKRRVHQKENDLKQKMAAEEIQQVQKEKSRRQEIIRKRRMHRNEERSNINEADMKYLQNTMDYKHGGISTAAGAATVDLSYVGLQMSELHGSSDECRVKCHRRCRHCRYSHLRQWIICRGSLFQWKRQLWKCSIISPWENIFRIPSS